MRITIEIETKDLARFHQSLKRSRHVAQEADEADILDAAKQALDSAPLATAPTYVRKRIGGVQRLITMLEDDAWALPAPCRIDVLEALVYFSDPEDLIPDDIEVIGLLDDAIMLELLLRKLAPCCAPTPISASSATNSPRRDPRRGMSMRRASRASATRCARGLAEAGARRRVTGVRAAHRCSACSSRRCSDSPAAPCRLRSARARNGPGRHRCRHG